MSNFIKDQIFHKPVANYECNLWSLKIFQVPLYKKLHEKSCCYLVIIYMKKASLKGKANEILTACALVVICIHVSALDSCYMTNVPLHPHDDFKWIHYRGETFEILDIDEAPPSHSNGSYILVNSFFFSLFLYCQLDSMHSSMR